MIYHIYWGTSGNSGLYLDEIYQVLKENGYVQHVFVNFYYPFNYGDKIFLKRGDVANSKYKGTTRKIFQLFEILKGYLKILICSIKEKPNIINYSHAGKSYFFVVWFLKLVKYVSGARLIVTCHDVYLSGSENSEIYNRNKIFHIADKLLVHTRKSAEELIEIFGVEQGKIVSHLFPIMDLSKLSYNSLNPYEKVDFLFIGHLRKDKGIEFLLNSWLDFYKVNKVAKLRVCGRYIPGLSFDKVMLEKCNVEFHLHYINDEEYYHYIKATRYVILPYPHGTNSGILSTVISLGTDVITSDIPMFKENTLVSKENLFETENSQSLIDILQKKWIQKDNKHLDNLKQYRLEFRKGVLSVYNELIFASKT